MMRFKVELIRKSFSPLARQICEAVAIATNPAEIELNRRSEWNGSTIPKLVVQVKEKFLKTVKGKLKPVRKERENDEYDGPNKRAKKGEDGNDSKSSHDVPHNKLQDESLLSKSSHIDADDDFTCLQTALVPYV